MTVKELEKFISKKIRQIFGEDEVLSDWRGLTWRQILTEIERCFPNAVIFWGCWSQGELDYIF